MPHPFPLASAFTAGMRRDVDRTEIPGGGAYNLLDFIPDEVQAVTAGRGGWTYYGGSLSGVTSIQTIGHHPDTGKVVAVDQNRNLWDVSAGTQIGTFSTYLAGFAAPPVYHRGYLIVPNNSGSSSPAYYKSDGTIGSLSGAPTAECATVYKDRTVLASTPGAHQRVWFSAAGDPTTWDTSFGWWDTSGPIAALAGLTNSILIFHADSTERLRGTTPPPGSDMVLEPFIPNVGCVDVRSLKLWNQSAIFASSQGIYMTDGVKVIDLTAQAQMKTYWNALMTNYSPGAWEIAGGIYRDHYLISVFNGTTHDCLCVNLLNQTMWRFSNIHGSSFKNVQYAQQEKLYMGGADFGRVAELSSLWAPSASVKLDGNGTAPTPIVETAMYRGYDRLHRRWIESMGKQKWRFAYLDYDLRDAASDNPTMTLSYCTTPSGSYTATDRTFPATTTFTRGRRSLSPTQGGGTHSQQLGLKLAVNGPYATAALYTIEGSFEPIEIGAL